MEIILNKCYGGPSFSEAFCEKYGVNRYDVDDKRTDPAIIAAVREFGEAAASGSMACLAICTIPGEVTDWELGEYDGIEFVTYVVDGKLGHC